MDSDFDNFLTPGKLSVKDNVLQTYTYSWENHYCFADSLQNHWRVLGIGSFDFRIFIDGFNKVVYPMLINVLAARLNNIDGWHLLDLCGKILHPSVTKAGVLDNNGTDLLLAMGNEVNTWARIQPSLDGAIIKQMQTICQSVGLVQDTTYLYMRGHCVYDLIMGIGDKLCGNRASFKLQVLDPSLTLAGYPEIEHVVKDARTIL